MENKNQTKKYASLLLIAFALIFTISLVNAEFWTCFGEGETRYYCDNYKDPVTCDNPNGCIFCTSFYDPVEDCYIHGSWPKCMNVPQDCSATGSNTTFDVTAPILIINNPINNEVYDTKSLTLDLSLDEEADVYYLDLINGRGRWTKVCTDCTSYSNRRNFKEGTNDLMFRAKDGMGNTNYTNLTFIVDSVDPKISKVLPTKGFSNGKFLVEFTEANPTELILFYGNSLIGTRTATLDITTDCTFNRKYYCEKEVELEDYDGQDIEYYFTLKDVANTIDESRHYTLKVDNTEPVLNNPNDFYTIDGKYVYFSLDITEINFKGAGYTYMDRGRERTKKLCTRLKNGICEKKVSFKDGEQDLTIYILDEALNKFEKNVSFFIDSKKPKISKVLPTRGFANGEFEVQFTEANPTELYLIYGNDLTGYKNKKLDISTDCYFNRKYYCDTTVDLTEFDGEEIEYWFNLTDIVENSVESRHYNLDVDVTPPTINNDPFFEVDGRYVYFNINITEENFDEVIYSYYDGNRLRERRLCSRLVDGICEKRVSFRNGDYNLNIQVIDDAANSIGVPISFTINY